MSALASTGEDRAAPPRVRSRMVAVYGTLFALGLAFGSGALNWVVHGAVEGFEALARAQYRLHLASQNLDAEGRAEFAVFLTGDSGRDALGAWVEAHQSVGMRESSIPGWRIVSLPPQGAAETLAELREMPFARAVLRNRGLWICH